jgi:hypothetical protein
MQLGGIGTPPHSVWQWAILSPNRGIQGAYEEIRAYVLDNTERWMELCALAAEEQDSVKLLALTQEITRLLGEKTRRITRRINGQILKPSP